MEFFCRTNTPSTIPSCSGTPFEKVYQFKFINGVKVLADTGERINTYEVIQADAESCAVSNIIAKCTDVSALRANASQMFDATMFPSCMEDYMNLQIKLNKQFDSLPVETRAKFNNNVNLFISSFGSDYWNESMNVKSAQTTSTQQSEPAVQNAQTTSTQQSKPAGQTSQINTSKEAKE